MKLMYALVGLAMSATAVLAAEYQVRVLGSSTVYPFTSAVAEKFGKLGHATPIVESTGTGGGIKMFCSDSSLESASIVNASRPIKDTEVASCNENGIAAPLEFKIGYDAIVLAHLKGYSLDLTTRQIYLALAKQIVVDGKFVDNPHVKWSDIDPALPDNKIEVLGPPPTSGTRDSFVELVIEKECKASIKESGLSLSEDEVKSLCKSIREDGGFVEAGENDNLIVQKLQNNPTSVGIFGFSFLEENLGALEGAKINGFSPNFETVVTNEYPVSRPLFIYVKKEHYDTNPDVRAFVAEYISEEAIGEEGYLVDKGLIPLPAEKLEAAITSLK